MFAILIVSMWAKHKKSGFTIVELLIVIVVIGILAAITIVAYNGIQNRSKNAKTVSAITAWSKAIKLYNADTGTWPSAHSCLGSSTTYVGNNSQCWNSTTWVVSTTFTNQLAPYLSGFPEPDTTDVTDGGANTPRRGALYHTTNRDIYAAFSGITSCPDTGLRNTTTSTEAAGIYCIYTLD